MRILISPAKKMTPDPDGLPPRQLPEFLAEAQLLMQTMQAMDDAALRRLWGCNEALAALNTGRLRRMSLTRALTPALFCYEGIQYRYMAPTVLETQQLAYLEEHLRILSGFYGVLRPFDGVVPYRLELQAKLEASGCKNLYEFWGEKPARALCAETDLVLNLASKEYSRLILPHLPKQTRCITCTFGTAVPGAPEKVLEKGTLCKMARGEMVRFLAENSITAPEELRAFDRLHYRYAEAYSSPTHLVFLAQPEK